MTLSNMTSTEDYRQLAAQEAGLAKAAVTNESRAQHYAMAAYYARLAEVREKVAGAEGMTKEQATTCNRAAHKNESQAPTRPADDFRQHAPAWRRK